MRGRASPVARCVVGGVLVVGLGLLGACGAGSDSPARPGLSGTGAEGGAAASSGGSTGTGTGGGPATGGATNTGGANGTGGDGVTSVEPPTTVIEVTEYASDCEAESCTGDERCLDCQFGTCCALPCPGQPCPEGLTSYCDRQGGIVCTAG